MQKLHALQLLVTIFILHKADMAKMEADPKTQEWWDVMMPMQKPLETRAEGEWWAEMEEVFHTD